jgi:hypothetical protein
MATVKFCNSCHLEKSIKDFSSGIVAGKLYLRTSCSKCENAKRTERLTRGGQTNARKVAWKRYEAKRKLRRLSESLDDVADWIWEDSRKSSKKRGIEHDLDLDTIRKIIANGCQYCDEIDLRMTLDRIDNSVGYIVSNIVPACIRCNYARGSMPFAN